MAYIPEPGAPAWKLSAAAAELVAVAAAVATAGSVFVAVTAVVAESRSSEQTAFLLFLLSEVHP